MATENTMIMNGIFLQAMGWAMADENTGEMKSGTTVHLGIPVDGTEFNITKGFNLSKFSADADFIDKIKPEMTGKSVQLKCLVKVTGKNTKLIPLDIKMAA